MQSEFLTLGIETSCDETAAAVLSGRKILSSVIFSQIETHKPFGGVVPEVASRNHLEKVNYAIDRALREAGVNLADIGLIAAPNAPGLIGALLVGVSTAKALAFALGIPVVAVNHIKAHLFSGAIEHRLEPPFLALVVSGGHSLLADVRDIDDIEIIGQTRDDAVGEAYDKVARVLGLDYPGGPAIDKLARSGNPEAIRFKRSLAGEDNFDFSFSGLKTSVINYMNSAKQRRETPDVADVAASFQEAAVESLVIKTVRALRKTGRKTLALGGGVAANSRLREYLETETEKEDARLILPSPIYCTDNAAMVGLVGYLEYEKSGEGSPLDFDAYSTKGI